LFSFKVPLPEGDMSEPSERGCFIMLPYNNNQGYNRIN